MAGAFGAEDQPHRGVAVASPPGSASPDEEAVPGFSEPPVAVERFPVHVPRHLPRRLPAGTMLGATASWLGGVFLLCYVLIPLGMALSGVNPAVIDSLPQALPAFGAAAMVVSVGAAVLRPSIRLGPAGPADPVVPATLGGLGVWAIAHNTSSLLQPFWDMGGAELASFLALNGVEMTLIGLMLGSFTRSRAVALALGGGFQLLTLGLFLALLGATAP